MAVIATVRNVQGAVFAVDVNGKTRVVRNGDQLQDGEVLVTGPGGSAELVFVNGKTLTVPEQQAFLLDPSVGGAAPPDATGAALSPLAQKVIQALKTGDLNALLETEATAAGVTGSGGGDGGSSFVQVLRQLENADGANVYQFGPNTFAALDSSNTTVVPDPVIDNPPGAAIAAVNDTGAIGEDSVVSLTGSVFGNDTTSTVPATLQVTAVRTGSEAAGEGSPGTVGAVLFGQFGALTLNSDGTYFYSLNVANGTVQALNVGGTLTDTFTYTMSDGALSDRAELVITINGANDGPVAVADVGSAGENESRAFDVVANDSDVDAGDTRTLVSVGTVTVTSANGDVNNIDASAAFSIVENQLRFDPATLFDKLDFNDTATATVNYTMRDSQGATSSSTLTLTVNGANDAPVAVADSGSAGENETKSVDVLANDTDVDTGDIRTLDSIGAVTVTSANGDVNNINASAAFSIVGNQLQFNPATLFDKLDFNDTATATVNYTMRDSQGATSSSTLTLTVNGANDAPVAVADTGSAGENETKSFDVLANDTDVDTGDTRTLDSIGAVTVTSANGDVNNINASPAFSIVGNQLQFDPATLFDKLDFNDTATATVNYTMRDSQGATSSSTLTLTVNGANDAPVAVADAGSAGENVMDSFDVLANDTDIDTGDTRWSLDSIGTVAVTSANGNVDNIDASSAFSIVDNRLRFSPGTLFDKLDFDDSATVTVGYTMKDGQGAPSSSTFTLTVNGANDAPVAGDDTVNGVEDTTLVIASADLFSGTGDDFDVDGPGFVSIRVTALPEGGEGGIGRLMFGGDPVTLNQVIQVADIAANKLTFQPNGNANGPASFRYTVSDGFASSNEATVSIRIAPVNDPAIITGTRTDTVTEAGGFGNAIAGDPTGAGDLNATDIDSSPTFVEQSDAPTASGYGFLTIDATGAWSYRLNNNNATVQALNTNNTGATALHDLVTVQTADGTTHTIDITINGANDGPVPNDVPVPADDTHRAFVGGQSIGGNVIIGADHGGGFFDIVDHDVDSAITVTKVRADGSDAADQSVPAPDGENPGGVTVSGQFGQLTINSDGGYSYSLFGDNERLTGLDDGETAGPDRFIYTVSDGSLSATAGLSITIAGVNDAPTPQPDQANVSVEEDPGPVPEAVGDPGTAGGNVLTNDSDVDGDPLTVTFIDADFDPAVAPAAVTENGVTISGQFGTLTIDRQGEFAYEQTQVPGPKGATENFTYTVNDGDANATAALRIIIGKGGNSAPVAQDDSLSVNEGSDPVSGNVVTGGGSGDVADIDDDGDSLIVTNLRTGTEDDIEGVPRPLDEPFSTTLGTLTLNSDGSYVFESTGGTGFETFTYTISDGDGGIDTGAFTITVENNNNLN